MRSNLHQKEFKRVRTPFVFHKFQMQRPKFILYHKFKKRPNFDWTMYNSLYYYSTLTAHILSYVGTWTCFFGMTHIYDILGFLLSVSSFWKKKIAEHSLMNYIHEVNVLSLRYWLSWFHFQSNNFEQANNSRFFLLSTHLTRFSSQFYKQRIVCRNYLIYSLKN